MLVNLARGQPRRLRSSLPIRARTSHSLSAWSNVVSDHRQLPTSILVLPVCVCFFFTPAHGQTQKRESGQELMSLIREGLAAKDPELRIAKMRAARQLEPKLHNWTLSIPRDRAKGLILGVLANGYKDRQKGDADQNIALAIDAYRQALQF